MSLLELATILGRDRNTVYAWIQKGCPVVQQSLPENGSEWILDLADVVKWRERQVIADSAKLDAAATDGILDGYPFAQIVDPAKRLTAIMKLLEMQERSKAVAPIEFQIAAIERVMAIVGASVMSVPEFLMRDMSGYPEAVRLAWLEKANTQCRNILDQMATTIEDSLISVPDEI